MYVRKKNNRSGSTSVVVVTKHNGRYKEIKSFGSSYDDSEIERLILQAKHWIETYGGQQLQDFDDKREREETERVVEQYHGLWVVERAFRVSKGTLEMRPMFHFSLKRIEAHVCICFVAYKVYKEVERQIQLAKIPLSVDKVIDIAKTVITMLIRMPENGGFFTKTMFLTDRHRSIMSLFDDKITQN